MTSKAFEDPKQNQLDDKRYDKKNDTTNNTKSCRKFTFKAELKHSAQLGKFNNLASIGWKVDMFSMVDAFHNHDRCNSGNLNSVNLFRCNAGKINNASLFQCDAGNFDRVHGFHADHFSVTGGAFSSECFFQYDSGNFNKHDYGEMCKTFS